MTHTAAEDILEHSELKRSITAKQLYFYVVGDVLGSGIYVLVGLVAAAVGGAFWMAFLAGVGDRPHHRPRVRRAGHQVPAGGRRLALHQQGLPHPAS